jgi:hypothetical protein
MCYAPKTQDLYILDTNMVRKLSKDGVVTTVAGAPEAGFRDGEPMQARFNLLNDCAVDQHGDVYLADSRNARIRKLSLQTGVTTVVGDGTVGRKDGDSSEASLIWVESLLLTSSENLYFSDNCWIRVLHNGVVSTLNTHQSGSANYMGGQRFTGQEYMYDGPIATQASFGGILFLAQNDGLIYIGDPQIRQLRILDKAQNVKSLLTPGDHELSYGAIIHDLDSIPEKKAIVIMVGGGVAVMDEKRNIGIIYKSSLTSRTKSPFPTFRRLAVGEPGIVYLMDTELQQITRFRFSD